MGFAGERSRGIFGLGLAIAGLALGVGAYEATWGVRSTAWIPVGATLVAGAAALVVGKRWLREMSETQEQLAHSEWRYRQLVEALPVGVAATREGQLVYANRILLDLLGVESLESIAWTPARRFIAPGHQAAARATIPPGGSTATGCAAEIHLQRRSGDAIPVELATTPVSRTGEAAFLHVVRDLRERKQLEEKIAQSHQIEAVGKLAGGIAHDFNNVLTVILGHTELLREQLASAGLDPESVERIAEAAGRSADLTRQLLAFGRRQFLQPRIVDLNRLVAGMCALLERVVPERIHLTTALDPDLPCVRVDPRQIEQVILNLVLNARDAISESGQIFIETHSSADHSSLSVRDDGCGMDAHTRRHIFEPFFTTKATGAGSGLGLSTVHGIVVQSGGELSVQSEPGQGTRIDVRLPAVTRAAASPFEASA